MSANLVSVTFYDEYTSTGGTGTNYIVGAVGDKMRAEAVFEIYWNTTGRAITFNASDKTIRMGLDAYGNSGSFIDDGFKVGNTVAITGSTSNNRVVTITELTDTIMTVSEFLVNEVVSTGCQLHGTTPVTSIDYLWNLIQNDAAEDYFSTTDKNTKARFSADGITATGSTVTAMVASTNSKGWNTGSASIEPVSYNNYRQRFKVIHNFIITPIFIKEFYQNFVDGLPPAAGLYEDFRSVKYIFKVDAKFEKTDPQVPHTSNWFDQLKAGNVGWFDEFVNGRDANYTFQSIAYTDTLSGAAVDAVQINRKTNVTITINSVYGKFGLIPTPSTIVLNHLYCPLDENDYVDTDSDWKTNFKHDRVYLQLGGPLGPLNGDNYGGDNQVITSATFNSVNLYQATITFTVDYSAAIKTFLLTKSTTNRNYCFFATPQANDVTTTKGLDRNAVLCAFDGLEVNNDDASLLKFPYGTRYYETPDVSTGGTTDAKVFIRDTVLSETIFQLHTAAGAVISKMRVRVEAYNTGATPSSFVLEEKNFDLSGFKACSGVQPLTWDEARGYRLGSGDERGVITIDRDATNDITNYTAFKLLYPFKARWEDWRLLGATAHDCFPNPTQQWLDYQTGNWRLRMSIYAEVTATGNTTLFTHTSDITLYDAAATGATRYVGIIETFNEAGTLNLNGSIQRDEDTFVRATFLVTGSSTFYGILQLDSTTDGGVTYMRQLNTDADCEASSPWYGAVNLTRAKLTNTATTSGGRCVKIEGYLDYTRLDFTQNAYSLSARLGIK